jgi:hypothetical protein
MFKRVMAFLLAAASLVTLAGCKKKKSLVENEKDAKEVIECPSDNMFGLEKVVVFEDRAVAVFDEKISEDFEYDENNRYQFSLKSYLDVDEPGFRLVVDNMKNIWPNEDESKIELKDGHYVVTIIFPNKESYKEDPDEDFVILALDIGDFGIWLEDDSIRLHYIARGYDIMWYYDQVFNRKTGKWAHVDEDEVGCMTEALD